MQKHVVYSSFILTSMYLHDELGLSSSGVEADLLACSVLSCVGLVAADVFTVEFGQIVWTTRPPELDPDLRTALRYTREAGLKISWLAVDVEVEAEPKVYSLDLSGWFKDISTGVICFCRSSTLYVMCIDEKYDSLSKVCPCSKGLDKKHRLVGCH